MRSEKLSEQSKAQEAVSAGQSIAIFLCVAKKKREVVIVMKGGFFLEEGRQHLQTFPLLHSFEGMVSSLCPEQQQQQQQNTNLDSKSYPKDIQLYIQFPLLKSA